MRLFVVLLVLLLAGCRIQSGGSRSGPGGQGGPPGPPPPPGAAQCTASAVCMRVVPVAPGPPLPGRLIVLWAPIGDDDESFLPELGYDAPFYGNERTAVIPYSAIVPPRRMQLFPPCLDRNRPECNRPAGVATGYVLVVPPTPGPIDPRVAGKSDHTAVGRVIVGYGTQPIPPGGVLRDVFPNGIAGGLAAYGVGRGPTGSFERVWLPAPGIAGPRPVSWFDLVSCTQANPRCDLPYPNLN